MKKILVLLIILLLPVEALAAFPVTFATLAGGSQPLSDFDTMFGVVGEMGQIQATATGTNTIALIPVTNMPTIAAYNNYQVFGFVASNTTTGGVTINVNSIGALNAYAADGSTQLGSGSLTAGAYYQFVYNSALNSGAGGFQILGSSSGGSLVLPNGTTATTQANTDSSTKVATDAFANPSTTNSASGSVTLPGGTIIKWGNSTSSGNTANNINQTFGTPFPNNCFSITMTPTDNVIQPSTVIPSTVNTSGFVATEGNYNFGTYYSGVNVYWIAVGD